MIIKIGQFHYVNTDKIVRVRSTDANGLIVTFDALEIRLKLDSIEAERLLDWCANQVLDRLDVANDGDLQEIQEAASVLPDGVIEKAKARRRAIESTRLEAALNLDIHKIMKESK